MDIVTNLLAKLFDAFKTKSPIAAAIILGLLAAALVFIETQGSTLFGEVSATWAKWINIALIALTGSRTTKILAEAEKKK